ncbi:MAG: hypothetical protein WBN75_18615 [Verrucomicrobiia bacterium]
MDSAIPRVTNICNRPPIPQCGTFTHELEKLHPDNSDKSRAGCHIKDKIRQQLQVLRDVGLLLHVERGCWRLP